MFTISDFEELLRARPDIDEPLLELERQAPPEVAAEIGRLMSTSIDAKLEAAERLANLGSAARGATRRLVANWFWTVDKSEQDRLFFAHLRMLHFHIQTSLIRIGAVAVRPLVLAMRESRSLGDVLAAMRDRAAVADLAAALGDELPTVRASAAAALGGIGDVGAVEPLVRALRDGVPAVRESAADALGRIGDPRSAEPLSDLLGDRDGDVQKNAATALRAVGTERAAQGLLAAVRTGGDAAAVAADAIRSMTDPRARPALLAALQEEDLDVVKAAAAGLGAAKDPELAAPLLELLLHQSQEVYSAGRSALHELDPQWGALEAAKEMTPRLLQALEVPGGGQADNDFRQRVLSVLTEIPDPRRVAPVVGLLQEADSKFRVAVIRALGGFNDPSAAEPLIGLLRDADSVFRAAAAEALDTIPNVPAEPLIAALNEEDVPAVRVKVVRTLTGIGGDAVFDALVGLIAISDGYDSRKDKRVDEKLVVVVHYLPRFIPADENRYRRAVQSLRDVIAICQGSQRCGSFGIFAERTLRGLEERAIRP